MLAVGESRHNRQAEPTEAHPTIPRALTILASVLENLVARNDQLAAVVSGSSSPNCTNKPANGPRSGSGSEAMGKNMKVFDGVRAPSISIPKYLERIYKYIKCSPSCFVVGYVYIDRLVHRHPELLVVSHNVHRLVVTSVMVASKMLDDEHYNNAFYARVGGVSNAELNRLELELLFLLDFQVVVSAPVFECYCLHLERQSLRIAHSLKTVRPSATNIASAMIAVSKDEGDGSRERDEISAP